MKLMFNYVIYFLGIYLINVEKCLFHKIKASEDIKFVCLWMPYINETNPHYSRLLYQSLYSLLSTHSSSFNSKTILRVLL